MNKTYYMHTLDGRPAFFDGEQICFLRRFGKPSMALAKSLKQIRLQQARSNEFRRSLGDYDEIKRYGYVRVTAAEA